MSLVVAGADGGGSKTRVWIAGVHGSHLAEAEGPGSAVTPGEAERSADVIANTLREALSTCRMENAIPRVLCIGVAGVGRDDQRHALWQALTNRGIADEVIVRTDAEIALGDAFGDGAGILLIGGTGSIAFARGPAGGSARCGGWGPVCGDEGGGAWIGRRALSIVTAASDGREPETALVGAILEAAKVHRIEELIPWGSSATPALLASLAPAVIAAAEDGDQRANALLSMAAEELVLHVRTLARKLFGEERAACPVALTGGLLIPGTAFRKRVEHRMKAAVPGAQVRTAEVVPVRGAIAAALGALRAGAS